jgi:hypothetical protein
VVFCFRDCLAELWRGDFWMGMYGGPTPKRHSLWSNDRFIQEAVEDGHLVMFILTFLLFSLSFMLFLW